MSWLHEDRELEMHASDAEVRRKESEREFHDVRFENEVRTPLRKYYSVTRASVEHMYCAVSERCLQKRVLEYGCGPEPYALAIAERAANVTGIDISPVAIDRARQRAVDRGFGNLDFVVMDGERLEFSDCSFDLVFGSSILHHLDLDASVGEIARVLKPGGSAVFLEPMGQNPLFNAYRRLTPAMRTPDEHPLKFADLKRCQASFDKAGFAFFHFLSLVAVPIRGSRAFDRTLGLLEHVDRFLLRLPGGQRLAWFVVMTLEQPRRPIADITHTPSLLDPS